MTELIVVALLSLIGVGAAGMLSRGLFFPSGGVADELTDAARSIGAAARAFASRQTSIVMALSGVIGFALFIGYGLRPAEAEPLPGMEHGIWVLLAFLVGAGGATLTGHAALRIASGAIEGVARGATQSVDEALRRSVRAGGAGALLQLSTGVLGNALLMLAILGYHGLFGDQRATALALAPAIVPLLAAYALGACVGALLGELGGGAFATAADIGADSGARELLLDDDSRSNPAVVANAAGDLTGGVAARASTAFASNACEDVLAMLVLSIAYTEHDARSVIALVALPLLARAFGVLGSVFGIFVVKTDDREGPLAPLLRGFAVALSLAVVGLAGAIQWLLPQQRGALFGGAAVGVLLSVALLGHSIFVSLSRYQPAREVADAARSGATLSVLQGALRGTEAMLVPAALGVAAVLLSGYLGHKSAIAGGPELALAALLLASSTVSSLWGPAALSSGISDASSAIIRMTIGRERRDVVGRLLALAEPATAQLTALRSAGAVQSMLCAVVGMLALQHLGGGAALQGPANHRTQLLLTLSGAAFALWVLARATLGPARAARRILEEIRRQMRHRPSQEEGSGEGALPDYAPCIELTSRLSLRAMLSPALMALGIPLLLLLVLRFGQDGDKGLAALASVASFLMGASVVGSLGGLFGAHVGALWGNAKKYIVTGAHGGRLLVDDSGGRTENPTFVAAVVGDTVGDSLKDVVVPVAQLLTRLLPALALVLWPLLFP